MLNANRKYNLEQQKNHFETTSKLKKYTNKIKLRVLEYKKEVLFYHAFVLIRIFRNLHHIR